MVGPVLLHWETDAEAYEEFFSELDRRLPFFKGALSMCPLAFSSDQEKAIIKARKKVFPNATHLFCLKHLKENLARHLDLLGFTPHQRIQCARIIFDAFAKRHKPPICDSD